MLKGSRVAGVLRQLLNASLQPPLPVVPRASAGSIRTCASRTVARSQPTRILRQRWRDALLRVRGRRHNGTKSAGAREKTQQRAQGLSARLKELSRKYGWAALGVYLGLSALDFPFCFMAVRWLGTERIAAAEKWVVENFWSVVGAVGLDMRHEQAREPQPASREEDGSLINQAAENKSEHHDASIWTQLILAYGVHKSLIFFRVPLTAAVTPKIVKWLRARGWKIGNPKA